MGNDQLRASPSVFFRAAAAAVFRLRTTTAMAALLLGMLALALAVSAAGRESLRLHWMAPFLSGGGYCSEAIAFVAALDRFTNVSVSLDQHGDSINREFFQALPAATQAAVMRLYREPVVPQDSIVVCHSEPGAWTPPRYPTTMCPPEGAAFRVGRTMFETDRLPAGWDERLNAMDEVWVPTAFHRDVFARGGVPLDKLVVLGEPVDTDEFDPSAVAPLPESVIEGTQGSTVRFLSVFKWEYRKGWDVLLKAFLGGFTRHDPVVLYILTSAYHSKGEFHAEIQSFVREQLACSNIDLAHDDMLVAHGSGDGRHSSSTDDRLPRPSDFCVVMSDDSDNREVRPAEADDTRSSDPVLRATAERLRHSIRRVRFSDLPRFRLLSKLSQADLRAAYRSVDALVLPSRGEGWGRPHVEAMAMALPVLTTNWSGPTAYLDESNGYPIAWTHLRPIPGGPFAGHLMAEPSEVALRTAMRRVIEHPDEARSRGAQARRDMVARFGPRRFALEIEEHVQRISRRLEASGVIPRRRPGARDPSGGTDPAIHQKRAAAMQGSDYTDSPEYRAAMARKGRSKQTQNQDQQGRNPRDEL